MSEKIIAAISTPRGVGGISVIRVSGKGSISLCDGLFKAYRKNVTLSDLNGYTGCYGEIRVNDEIIDEVVCFVYRAPHSYTGEDVVEISCHGGMYITEKVLRAVLDAGAEPAQGGEFTKRAFLNGKMDLTQAESVMDIISARGEQSARAALNARKGNTFKKVSAIKEKLIETATHLAAWADYPEEDVPEITAEEVKSAVTDVIDTLDEVVKNYDNGKIMRDGVDTVIIGRPNVGKSTIMNLLAGCERSIVTDIEGTTRDIIEEMVAIDDILLKLSDTAGIRHTDNVIEKIGVDRTMDKLKSCGLAIAVFDNSSALTDYDIQIIENLNGIPSIAIVNKTDLENKLDVEFIKSKFSEVVLMSAKYDDDINNFKNTIKRVIHYQKIDSNTVILANARQRDKILKAKSGLYEVLDAINAGLTLDAVTVAIEYAIDELCELTGEKASEQIINNIFEKFCVGK